MASSAADCQFSVTSPQRPMPQLKPLPLALVAAVCRQAKARNSVFLSSYLISDPNDFEDLCRKIYFPTTPISLGDITTMHGILACLLREHIAFQEPLPKEFDVTDHLRQCDKNFNVAIETYDILAIPAFENIFALSLGIMKAQGLSKPTLCCSLLSAASSQCRILGYCREGIYKNLSTKTASQMRRVFWSVYIFDKNISLIHGRPSYLQDFEIDTLYPKASTDPKRRPWDESFIMAIKFATIQGLIYRHCYSKDAVMYTIPERELRITELSVDLKEWYSRFKQIDYSRVNNTQIFKLSRINWDVMYYSTLTLLLRPIPSSDGRGYVSSQCFEAARSSLQSHLLCFSAYPNQQNLTISKADYADWILHLSSFTPFIVVFLHSIAAKSEEDVHLLNQVVETLRSINSVSKATERLYKICAALAQVANAIVESGVIRVEGYDKVQDSLHFINNLDHIIRYNDHMENGLLLQDPEELAGVVHDWVVGESPSWW
ncbi:fungal specific transcription factor domain-containing protein [Trichoderma breve]|uniref:Fungal specific transcription factor domain-containing protein n=1 Tax=Trichoderma breve TaxID=2034170 RepID=A0A9W9JRF9_9HYPO|nr:fungal specific transcription factor domain-containing protein [Trichoderma breve]KAJ4864808.1 fungal specific transcription factor domain-containing protein [Trichoderma breve]